MKAPEGDGLKQDGDPSCGQPVENPVHSKLSVVFEREDTVDERPGK